MATGAAWLDISSTTAVTYGVIFSPQKRNRVQGSLPGAAFGYRMQERTVFYFGPKNAISTRVIVACS